MHEAVCVLLLFGIAKRDNEQIRILKIKQLTDQILVCSLVKTCFCFNLDIIEQIQLNNILVFKPRYILSKALLCTFFQEIAPCFGQNNNSTHSIPILIVYVLKYTISHKTQEVIHLLTFDNVSPLILADHNKLCLLADYTRIGYFQKHDSNTKSNLKKQPRNQGQPVSLTVA